MRATWRTWRHTETQNPKTPKSEREKKMIKIEKTLNVERMNLNNVILEEFEGEKN